MTTDELELRSATPDDALDIARVDATGRGVSATEVLPLIRGDLERIERGELERYTCVAELQDRIVGYARAGIPAWADQRSSELPRGWYLIGVTVDPAYRRRGIGRALTLHRLHWLRQHAESVHCLTSIENTASIALHERLGFESIARDIVSPETPDRGATYLLLRATLA